MINVVFVMVGNKYIPAQVIRLYNQLKQYGPDHTYWVCTDRDDRTDWGGILPIKIPDIYHLHGVWNKLWMFSEEFPVAGPVMYFDIDTVILSHPFNVVIPTRSSARGLDGKDVLRVVDCHWKPPSIVRLTNYDVLINSSVMAWHSPNQHIHQIWNHFQYSGQRDYFVKKYVGIDRFLVHEFPEEMMGTFPSALIRSHKYEPATKIAPIVTFEEVNFGSIDLSQIT